MMNSADAVERIGHAQHHLAQGLGHEAAHARQILVELRG